MGLTPPMVNSDTREYQVLAANIREHASFSLDTGAADSPTTRRGPTYPLFVAVFGNATRFVQCALDAAVAAMICLIAGLRVRTRWAVAAGLLYAVHPGAVAYANALLIESVLTFLMTATVVMLVIAARRDAAGWAVGAGALFALATLCRAVVAPFLLVTVVLLKPRRLAVAFCAAAVLALAPWIIRSSLLAGRFVLSSTGGFVNFALATANGPWNLNDQASFFEGRYYWEVDPCGRLIGDPLLSPRRAAEMDDVCLQEALINLKRDPGYYARSRLSQLIHFPLTSFDFVTGNRLTLGAAVAQRQVRVLAVKGLLYAIFSLAPLALAMVGLLLGTPTIENRLAAALWIFIVLIYAPGFVTYRYFLAAVPMLLVSAAFGLEKILRPSPRPQDDVTPRRHVTSRT